MANRIATTALILALGATPAARPQAPGGSKAPSAGASRYDPLAVDGRKPADPIDLSFRDAGRDREIPLLVYLPADGGARAPVVLFSHGLGGSRNGSAALGRHWAARGYVAVFVQHPGSDTSAWQDAPIGQRMAVLKKAASLENFLLRARDIPAVLDRLETWDAEQGHPLAGRLDMTKVGMSGHSFGAVTTQAVGGQAFLGGAPGLTDPRIRAAIALSPSPPRAGPPERAFGGVKIPWLLITGTHDDSPIGDIDAKSRLKVFPALPRGGKYELVLDGAEHSLIAERPLPGERRARNPNHQRAILALSTAFWDAHLRGQSDAREWLDGKGPRSVLDPADRWQTK
ncbi:MAG: hypothetical protein U0800_02010 [Isosphaeraceae bacterium]